MAFTPIDAKDCPIKESHGNPFRYCPECTWIETPTGLEPSDYREALVRAVFTGEPLDFRGVSVPADVQAEIKKYVDKGAAPSQHACIIDADIDHMAYRTQYLIGCQCHEGNVKHIWQPGDPAYKCPVSGVTIVNPRDLIPSDQP